MSLSDLLNLAARPVMNSSLVIVAFAYLRVSHQRSVEKETSETTQRRVLEE